MYPTYSGQDTGLSHEETRYPIANPFSRCGITPPHPTPCIHLPIHFIPLHLSGLNIMGRNVYFCVMCSEKWDKVKMLGVFTSLGHTGVFLYWYWFQTIFGFVTASPLQWKAKQTRGSRPQYREVYCWGSDFIGCAGACHIGPTFKVNFFAELNLEMAYL